jgi:drug/metabolite transporter (DMT)-like permease
MTAGARPFLALLVGLLAVSLAGPFILLASPIGPFALPAWRLLAVAVLLLPLAGRYVIADLRGLTPGERWRLVASGVLYGAHFSAFTAAFDFTSKESAVMLLAGQPLLGAAYGALFLGESITRAMIASSAVAIAGLVVFVQHDIDLGRDALIGDALVLLCGGLIVVCYGLGRRLRPRMSLSGYLTVLYAVGGLTCLTAALFMGDPLWGYARDDWFWLLCAVLVSTLVGHSAFHYAVKFVPMFQVNLTILGEPVIALAAMALLHDSLPEFQASTLTVRQALGGTLLLAGVGLGLWWGRERVQAPPAETTPTPQG